MEPLTLRDRFWAKVFGISNQRVHEIVKGEGWQNVERPT